MRIYHFQPIFKIKHEFFGMSCISYIYLMWVYVSKIEYTERDTIKIATSHSQAVTVCAGSGISAVLPILEPLGIDAGPFLKTYLFVCMS